MHPTTFVYSSHDCSPFMHWEYIVRRALEDHHDKRIVYLPMSEYPALGDVLESQKFGYGKFEWYLRQFKKWGLQPTPFYWSDGLRRQDVEVLIEMLLNAPVVILGAGNPSTGMRRYHALGSRYFGDPHLFCRLLHERQANGKLTVGYSAGADQLGSVLASGVIHGGEHVTGFGLARDIAVQLHHEWGREGDLQHGASSVQHCMWFGLPNDSGLAINQGTLSSGLIWQLIRFVIDNSWDYPSDGFHIKTRQGMKIEHRYADGRSWNFTGGDAMLRVMANDGSYRRSFMFVQGHTLDYSDQLPSSFSSMGEILHAHS